MFYDIEERLPWLKKHNVEIRWVPRELFEKRSYYATAVERFCYKFESDCVLMLDADTVLVRNIEDLVEEAMADHSLHGVIAYASPLKNGMNWERIWKAGGLPNPELNYKLNGFPYWILEDYTDYAPAYLNLGMLVASGETMTRLGTEIYQMMDACESVFPTHFKCQIGLGMAADKLGIPVRSLPMRYNFANHMVLEALHGGEMLDIRVLHFLAEHQEIGRDKMFNTKSEMEKFLARTDLANVNATFAATYRELFDEVAAEQEQVLSPFQWDYASTETQ